MNGSDKLRELLQALEAQSAQSADESTKNGARGPATREAVRDLAVEHNVPTGASSPSSYLPELYDAQRDLGLRVGSGAARLTKLKPRHKQVIALHLAGWPNNQIAKQLNMSAAWICTLLKDPLAQEVVNNFEDLHDEEFKRLRVLANDALRDALQPHKPDRTRLQAARTFYQRDAQTAADAGETAEDVMSKILARIEAENVQINFNLHQSG